LRLNITFLNFRVRDKSSHNQAAMKKLVGHQIMAAAILLAVAVKADAQHSTS
jgi:hypothetical protein